MDITGAPVWFQGARIGTAKHVEDVVDGIAIEVQIDLSTQVGRQAWDQIQDNTPGFSIGTDDVEMLEDDITFEQDLAQVINRHSRESASGTPDFVLAAYLVNCLEAFQHGVAQRAAFRGEQVEFKPFGKVSLIDYGPSHTGLGFIESIDGEPVDRKKSDD
jgi:hypothetical protein